MSDEEETPVTTKEPSDALVKALIRSLGAKMLEAERHCTDDQPWTRPTLKKPDHL